MTIDQERIWSLGLDALASFYADVLRENDRAVIRALILADRFFLLTMVLDVKVAWHPWVLARCREVERDPDEHLDLWSREHFKSTIITYAGVAQYVLGHPEDSVCILSYKAGAAQSFVSQIKTAFETNEILNSCFPDVLWGKRTDLAPRWSTTEGIVVRRKTGRKESTVDASGLVSGMKTGGHYDLLVYDDTVTYESVTNPEQIDRTTAAWSMSQPLGKERARHWYIGTRYAMFDTYYVMMQRGIKERRHVCVDAQGRSVLLPQDVLDKKRREMETRDWMSQYMQTPVGEGELLFKEDWMQTCERPPQIPMNVYILADTAQKQGKANDYTVFWVLGLGADKRYYVLDVVRDKLTQSMRCDRLFALVEKWSPISVFYEENAAPDDAEFITSKMQTRGRFNLRTFRQKPSDGSKRQRIETLEPDFREGLFWFPSALKYRQYDGTWRDLIHDFMADEFLSYPQVTHDDMLDALASKNHASVRPYLDFPTMRRRADDLSAVERERFGARRHGDDALFVR